MAQTDAEKRAYMRGYNRGRNRAFGLWRRLADIAEGYRQRFQEPRADRHCDGCRRWSRPRPEYLWGFCAADFDGHEPRMWADLGRGEREPRRIVTQEKFGCVNWLPLPTKDPTHDQG